MKKNLLAMVAVALLVGPMAANAVIITTSLNNVTIGSDIYNVTFSQDDDGFTLFNDVFGSGSPLLTFTTEADAFAAAVAVRAAADPLNFDYTPAGDRGAFILPFSFDATSYLHVTGWSDDLANSMMAFSGRFPQVVLRAWPLPRSHRSSGWPPSPNPAHSRCSVSALLDSDSLAVVAQRTDE